MLSTTPVHLPSPWTNVYGLARTLLALGTLLTLAFSNSATLFRPVAFQGEHPTCRGVEAGGVFCLVPGDGLDATRWACVAVLLIVVSGWRPRLTALPHAYISFSVFTGIAIGDGGDQMTTVLVLLLTLPALGDSRMVALEHHRLRHRAPALAAADRNQRLGRGATADVVRVLPSVRLEAAARRVG